MVRSSPVSGIHRPNSLVQTAFLIIKKANNPIHCALSLVGEPIMYPHINEFVDYLHDKGISTYLVTNAQFPDAIATLPPITQVCHWQIA